MKLRMYFTAVATVLLWSNAFIMNWDPQQVVVMLLLAPVCLLSIPIILIWNIFGVIKLWPHYCSRSRIPLGIFVLGFLLTPGVSQIGLHLRVERFRKQISEYERLARVALRNDKSEMDGLGLKATEGYGQSRVICLSEGFRRLASRMEVPKNPADAGTTVVFVSMGGVIHDCYLYRSDGDMTNTIRKMGFHLQAQITTNWCAVAY